MGLVTPSALSPRINHNCVKSVIGVHETCPGHLWKFSGGTQQKVFIQNTSWFYLSQQYCHSVVVGYFSGTPMPTDNTTKIILHGTGVKWPLQKSIATFYHLHGTSISSRWIDGQTWDFWPQNGWSWQISLPFIPFRLTNMTFSQDNNLRMVSCWPTVSSEVIWQHNMFQYWIWWWLVTWRH